MKRLLFLIALLGGTPFYGCAQGLVLNSGDTYTLEFTNFHFESHLPIPVDPYTRVLIGTHNFTGAFLLEAFEDNTAQVPLFSTNAIAGSAPTDFYFGPAWEDLQGVIRIDMLSGSMNLVVILGAVITPGGNVYSQSVTPVPEPTTWSLLALGAVALLASRHLHCRSS